MAFRDAGRQQAARLNGRNGEVPHNPSHNPRVDQGTGNPKLTPMQVTSLKQFIPKNNSWNIVTSLHVCRLHLLSRICHVIADYCHLNSVFLWYRGILAVSHLLLSKVYCTSCLLLTAPLSAGDSNNSQEQRHCNGRCLTALRRETTPMRWITFTEPVYLPLRVVRHVMCMCISNGAVRLYL